MYLPDLAASLRRVGECHYQMIAMITAMMAQGTKRMPPMMMSTSLSRVMYPRKILVARRAISVYHAIALMAPLTKRVMR